MALVLLGGLEQPPFEGDVAGGRFFPAEAFRAAVDDELSLVGVAVVDHLEGGDPGLYLDGQFVETVNTGREQGQPRPSQQTVFTVADLPNGSHTLMVVKKSGLYMLLDRIDALRPSLPGGAMASRISSACSIVGAAGTTTDGSPPPAHMTATRPFVACTDDIMSANVPGQPCSCSNQRMRERGEARSQSISWLLTAGNLLNVADSSARLSAAVSTDTVPSASGFRSSMNRGRSR
ncbi:hypothetical protein [Actinoplanes sp. NPDC051494]|uniref:hypothetical protein n=1 Tax=Actinoplanes sp. NPDC051494 TaxID=3363907 RepID=UPI00378ADA79